MTQFVVKGSRAFIQMEIYIHCGTYYAFLNRKLETYMHQFMNVDALEKEKNQHSLI